MRLLIRARTVDGCPALPELDRRRSSCEQVEGSSLTLTKELAVFERKAPGRRRAKCRLAILTRNQMEKQTVNAFTPGVIEPSFGAELRVFETQALCAT